MSDSTHVDVGYVLYGTTEGKGWIGSKYRKLEHAVASAKRHLVAGAESVSVQEVQITYDYTWVWISETAAAERTTTAAAPALGEVASPGEDLN